MQETLRVLRGLQELDGDLFRVQDELRRLPDELARRRTSIDLQKHGMAEFEHKLLELRARVKEIEDMTTMQRQRIRKLEGEAASARSDTALIMAFQHEIRTVKRDVSEAEEEGLGLVEEVEELERQRDELAAKVEAAEANFAELATNVEREITAAEARRSELDAQRAERLGPVAPDIVAQYQKLLAAREGQAMALLEGRICQGCYVSVPNNIYVRLARGGDLVNCPSCGRILYLPELD